MNQPIEKKLIDHLFRQEAGKMISVLAKIFGFSRLDEAEDVVQETFIAAFETWKINGIPENPTAWLFKVAKNKLLNHISRGKNYEKILKENHSVFPIEYRLSAKLEEEINHLEDSQIQMLFAISHPEIPVDSRVVLALKTLCGFSIEEIAKSFLTNKETINKKLYRAREKIKEKKIEIIKLDGINYKDRMGSVLKCLYLLFNEGYFSSSKKAILRKDLCLEAMRLCLLLIEFPITNTEEVNALMALMCFHSSRFESRIDSYGEILSLDEQDKNTWNIDLIQKGIFFLQASQKENTILTDYHLEAMIAFLHTQVDNQEKWENLLVLYDKLIELHDNPIIQLNRIYVLSKVKTEKIAVEELKKIKKLETNYLYYTLMGKLFLKINPKEAEKNFSLALKFCNTESEKKIILKKYLKK